MNEWATGLTPLPTEYEEETIKQIRRCLK